MAARYEIYEDEAGEWRWRLIAGNGQIVIPPESFKTKAHAQRAIKDAAAASAEATKFEYGETTYRVTTKEST